MLIRELIYGRKFGISIWHIKMAFGLCKGVVGHGPAWSKFWLKHPAKEGADHAELANIYSSHRLLGLFGWDKSLIL